MVADWRLKGGQGRKQNLEALSRAQIKISRHCPRRLSRPHLRKASGFPADSRPEVVLQDACPSERRSLSATQAAQPQVIVHQMEHSLDNCARPSPPWGRGWAAAGVFFSRRERARGLSGAGHRSTDRA
jgi:hypothetical protein